MVESLSLYNDSSVAVSQANKPAGTWEPAMKILYHYFSHACSLKLQFPFMCKMCYYNSRMLASKLLFFVWILRNGTKYFGRSRIRDKFT